MIADKRDPSTAGQARVDHGDGRAPLGRAVRGLDLNVDQDGIAVLHQRVCRVTKLGIDAKHLAELLVLYEQ